MSATKQRSRNAMLGLAVGDAISWTSIFHRSFLLPKWTRRIRREIEISSEDNHVIVMPMPFSLNQPVQHFDISPTDKTEWAAFTAENLLKKNSSYEETIRHEWKNLAESKETIRGAISTQAALQNIRNGILPPQSGKQNPHYFDDGAMVRAVPIGIICGGNPKEAARLAALDASVTNSEDGVWAAQATAVLLSLLCSEQEFQQAYEAAIMQLPNNSWIRRIVDDAIKISALSSNSIFSILPVLHNKIVNREYSYGNIAPETLALVLVIAKAHHNNFETAVTTAAAFAKSGETLPVIVGAVVGAMQKTEFLSEHWVTSVQLMKGIGIPSYAEKNYLELVERISLTAEKDK
ncbi:MAG: ADP-ribosylglycohydrolase family protein [Bacteroidetes bacterium]|nr:ADP-ribosylglycohydrolase family protein [Bacteroidota bacterium]